MLYKYYPEKCQSQEITTFAHGYSWFVWRQQNNHLGLTPANGISPNFQLTSKV